MKYILLLCNKLYVDIAKYLKDDANFILIEKDRYVALNVEKTLLSKNKKIYTIYSII